jgi:Ca2+-binding RTX toxin-like protein
LAFVNSYIPVNMLNGFDFGNLYYGVSYTTTSTLFIADYADGTSDGLGGYGFSYDYYYGTPTGSGIVTSYLHYDYTGNLLLGVSGINVAASDVLIAATTYSTADDALVVQVALAGSDTIWGSDYADVLDGFYGNDTIKGFAGNDVAYGEAGNDRIYGDAGNDTVSGGSGDDFLNGGAGRDTLIGGAGYDRFDFTARPSSVTADRIVDFNPAFDTIRLDNAVMPGLGASTGTLAAGKFWVGLHAHDANDRVIYDSAHGKLLYDSNGSAAGGEVLVATLSPGLHMTYQDIVVI